jgi:transcriptional regulator with XRE-family HTH domain
MSGLAGRLKTIREYFGLSTADMAHRVGLKNRKSWEGYEKAVGVPKADVLYILACHGIDPWWLLSGEGEMIRSISSDPVDDQAVCTSDVSPLDADLLQSVIEEADRYNRSHQLFDGFTQMARAISLSYCMIQNERAKGNEVSLEALHFIMKAGRAEKNG